VLCKLLYSNLLYIDKNTQSSNSKWLKAELNCRPWAYESPALTTELLSQNLTILIMPQLSRFRKSKILIALKSPPKIGQICCRGIGIGKIGEGTKHLLHPQPMDIKQGFVNAVGNTPLIRLNSFSDQTGCEILGKAEFLNPGGSVKDRAALYIIEDAEAKGLLKPGGTVVEGTAGNTGIGLAHICNAKGYKCLIVIPDTQSQEKMDALRVLGAEVRAVPAVPYKDPNNYVKLSGRLAAETENAVWANQFDNLANRIAHYETTGPEIWVQTDGKIDAWVSSTGTGGTYAGVAMYLKEKNSNIKTVLADPMGSGLYSYVKTGEIHMEGSSVTEGIGNSRVTGNLEGAPIDDAIQVDDRECIRVIYQLLRKDGLFMGGSVGINVGAAVALAKQLGPGHTIVTVLCDGGTRYQSKLYNPQWLAEKGLLPS
jgi:cysteine synthase